MKNFENIISLGAFCFIAGIVTFSRQTGPTIHFDR